MREAPTVPGESVPVCVRFKLPWGTLVGECHGPEGAPCVLALHGWLDNAASFRRLAAQLPGVRVIAIDLAGHGQSDHRPPGVRYHFVDHVDDVIEVLDQLSVSSVTLLGHSMGAGIATLVAAIDPRVSGLWLIEGLGPLSGDDDESVDTLAKAVADMKRLGPTRLTRFASRQEAAEARSRGMAGLSLDAARILCERGLKVVDTHWVWSSDPRLRATSALRMTEHTVRNFLRRLSMPVRLVIGSESALNIGERYAGRLECIRHLSLHQLPGGHHLHLEADTVNAVADVLRSASQPAIRATP